MIVESSNSLPRGLMGLVLLLALLLVALVIWLTLGMGIFQQSSGGLVAIQPMPGGAVIPTSTLAAPPVDGVSAAGGEAGGEAGNQAGETSGSEAAGTAGESGGASASDESSRGSLIDAAVAEASSATGFGVPVFAPNQSVIVTSDATAESSPMPLLLAPDVNSDPLDIYSSGTIFTILEPGAGFIGYPVIIDDVSWVRVRDGNGLVGWTKAQMLEVRPLSEANEAPPLLIDQVRQQGQETAGQSAEQPATEPAAQPVEAAPAVQLTVEPAQEPTPTSTPAG